MLLVRKTGSEKISEILYLLNCSSTSYHIFRQKMYMDKIFDINIHVYTRNPKHVMIAKTVVIFSKKM